MVGGGFVGGLGTGRGGGARAAIRPETVGKCAVTLAPEPCEIGGALCESYAKSGPLAGSLSRLRRSAHVRGSQSRTILDVVVERAFVAGKLLTCEYVRRSGCSAHAGRTQADT